MRTEYNFFLEKSGVLRPIRRFQHGLYGRIVIASVLTFKNRASYI